MKNKKLTFKIGDEKVEFNTFQLTKLPVIVNSCYRVNVIYECIKEMFNKQYLEDPLTICIVYEGTKKMRNFFFN